MLKDELRKELKSLLPDNHPFLTKFDEHCPDTYEDPIDELAEGIEDDPFSITPFSLLVDTINDWKRGIRDWSEVEHYLTDAERELNLA